MSQITVPTVLKELRYLSPFEQLKVIATILPEIEIKLPKELVKKTYSKRKSLYGFWKNMGFDISDKDITQMRTEEWKNFPREDIYK